jgi:hypothetical protein
MSCLFSFLPLSSLSLSLYVAFLPSLVEVEALMINAVEYINPF